MHNITAYSVHLTGYYSETSDAYCNPCPAANACPNTTVATVIPCLEGTYAPEASTECYPCPAGWQCPYTDGHGNAPCVEVRKNKKKKTIWRCKHAVYKNFLRLQSNVFFLQFVHVYTYM